MVMRWQGSLGEGAMAVWRALCVLTACAFRDTAWGPGDAPEL